MKFEHANITSCHTCILLFSSHKVISIIPDICKITHWNLYVLLPLQHRDVHFNPTITFEWWIDASQNMFLMNFCGQALIVTISSVES